jgi:hypothetical protein
MRAASQPIPYLRHQRSDVRPGRAGHPELEVPAIETRHVEGAHSDPPGRGLDGVSLPGGCVELSAADLHRREGGRPLLDLTDECLRRPVDLVQGDVDGCRPDHSAIGVEGVRLFPQPGRPLVLLVEIPEEPEEPGGSSHSHEQESRGHGVQRPGVPHLPRVEGASHRVDGVMRGDPGRLVDEEESVRRGH